MFLALLSIVKYYMVKPPALLRIPIFSHTLIFYQLNLRLEIRNDSFQLILEISF